ncbi:hypothetical protein [uncultured Muribaculum sp.]|uniref:hypothetical protein n=1 Tax=uncultured Muribaculum sp. TaxID=1918613 RepID=UPI0025DB88B2|nr:hypothetical protein [uncultured Muribaculum sp.]
MIKFLPFVLMLAICGGTAFAKTYTPESPRGQKSTYDAVANTVTVSATAPTQTEFDWETFLQEDLPYISYVLIERHISGTSWYDNDYEIGRVTDVTPGKEFQFIDKEVEADRKYEYKLTCYVDDEHGTSSYTTIYTGINPGQITAFSATTPDHLTGTVNFSVTAPSLSDKGVTLTSPLTIEIQESIDWTWTAIHSIEDVQPGTTVTWQLTDIPLGKSLHYRAVARSGSAGVGEGLEADTYTGLDIPGTPRNFKCVVEDETARMTWDMPEKGYRGGCFDPESTTYNITRKFNDGTTETAISGVRGTEYVDKPDFAEAATVTYVIEAVNDAGTSMTAAEHKPVSVGAPAKLPFCESFASEKLAHRGWILESTQDDPYYRYEAWEFIPDALMYYFPSDDYLDVTPQDNDGGMASCKFYGHSADGQTESLISSAIDTKGVDGVDFKFHLYDVCAEATKNTVTAYISRDGGEWENVYASEPSSETVPGWHEVSIPVSLGAKCNVLKVKIDATRHEGPITNVYIDNISVKSNSSSAIDEIDDARLTDTPAEYFNLRGVRIAEPSEAGIYIVRRGTSVAKVIVR